MKHFLSCIFVVLALVSCGNKSEKEVEEEISSGVVLVQNQSYYEVNLSNGKSLYFSSYDKTDGLQNLEFDKDSVKVATSYGTGFFVSSEGIIATNAHVVSNMIADKDVNKSVKDVIDGLKNLLSLAYDELYEEYKQAVDAYDIANTDPEISYDTFYKIRDYRDAISDKLYEYRDMYSDLSNIRISESDIIYHNEISVAFNNTFVTNVKDFHSCVVKQTDADHDLALIQLKDKKTPEDRHIFAIAEEDPLESYSFCENMLNKIGKDKNEKLCMASFNLGPTLALTEDGIKSQFNTGSISQKTNDRLLYSIPTLPGSSGSPVVNLQGQLVAVNYAGLKTTQNFNYGIRFKHLKALMDK